MRRTALAKRRPLQMVAQGVPLPAPVGGWDAISPLANMPVDRAVKLDNWMPRPGWIEPRNGFLPQCTGLGTTTTPVETVMPYNAMDGTSQLFGVAGSTIYDCSTAGIAVATSVTTLTSARMQYCQFTNPSFTQYLFACNGQDQSKLYNGTTWSDVSITGTNVDSTTFDNVAVHQGRLWFNQKHTSNPVYMPVNAITGTGTVFPLGQFLTMGGYIIAIGTWTVDTRQNVDEYIAFVSSRGQVIVYMGTDPSSSSTWSEVGIYNIGRPIGSRCLSRIAGDLLIITVDGVVGMSEMLSTDRAAANRVSLTSKILNAMAQSARLYMTNFGWQIIEYARSTMSILNIPQQENLTQVQYVMNTITGAWCQFIGINANAWCVTAGDLVYFGGNNGTVYQFDVGSSDNGANISCVVETAYNPFGNAPQVKRYTMLQPLITTTGSPIPSVGINVDFKESGILSTEEPLSAVLPLWDQVLWDQFLWPVLAATTNNWITVNGIGHYVSIVTKIQTTQNMGNPRATVSFQLNGWNIVAESGAFV